MVYNDYYTKKAVGILQSIDNCRLDTDVSLSNLTTFSIGGNALLCTPTTISALMRVITALSNSGIPYFVLGRGSNCLADDDGYNGVIIKLGGQLCRCRVSGNMLIAYAGATTGAVSNLAIRSGLSGAEFCACIPASIGGCTVLNSGCYGSQMSDIVDSTLLTDGKRLFTYTNAQMKYSYRSSVLKGDRLIVLATKLKLSPAPRLDIQRKISDIWASKSKTQPLDLPSAGSVFMREGNVIPARLIEQAGLKGATVFGAQVSYKHSGFIVNAGKARSVDVKKLIDIITKRIYAEYGIMLKREITYIE
ncbi:MAG: UDP-N-acetylmuramate dehydrogenase [Clostridia bacterium]|nr:UDP-N-acetylmuramate dehydrogenase [Clostridia bacterium]MDD3832092.1 UDP-N-acetylmuramate dehydrogenase [Clostridia bacterium]